MSNEEAFEQWRAHQEAGLEHIKAEIFKANSYLQCLYQLRDAAILCSFPGGMKVESRKITIPKEEADAWVEKGYPLEELARAYGERKNDT